MNIKTTSYYTLLFLLFSLFVACEGEDEPYPSYIFIDSATCIADYQIHGTSSHKLNTAWLFVEPQTLGVYDMPHSEDIPVLLSGERSVTVRPGFWENGISGTSIISPIHNNYNTTLNLNLLESDTISPVFTYRSDVEMLFNNDFEGSNNFEAKGGTVSPSLILEGVFEGNTAAKIELNANNTFFRFGTAETYEIPIGNIATILEMNYKNSAPMLFYIVAYIQSGTAQEVREYFGVVLKEQEDWNKIYIDLTQPIIQLINDINQSVNNVSFEIGFEGALPSDTTNAAFYFDNIKVLERK